MQKKTPCMVQNLRLWHSHIGSSQHTIASNAWFGFDLEI
jgi:hypothetical protein